MYSVVDPASAACTVGATTAAIWAADLVWDLAKGAVGNELHLQMRRRLPDAYSRFTRDKLPPDHDLAKAVRAALERALLSFATGVQATTDRNPSAFAKAKAYLLRGPEFAGQERLALRAQEGPWLKAFRELVNDEQRLQELEVISADTARTLLATAVSEPARELLHRSVQHWAERHLAGVPGWPAQWQRCLDEGWDTIAEGDDRITLYQAWALHFREAIMHKQDVFNIFVAGELADGIPASVCADIHKALHSQLEALHDRLKAQLDRMEGKLDRVTERTDQVHEGVTAIMDAVTDQNETLAKILQAVTAGGRIGAGQNQLAHNTLLALAQRLRKDDLADFDQAVRELEVAVEVAIELIAKGHSAYYQDRFVDDVLARVTQSIEANSFEKGAQALDDALAELDRREVSEREAAKRRRVQLLKATVQQALLLRYPQRVADAELRLVAMDHEVRPVMSQALLDRLEAYYKEGKQRDLSLPLKVAEALARTRLAEATPGDERGEALIWLGRVLNVLGERDIGTATLDKALQAYSAASVEFARNANPLGWARTELGIGNALWAIGLREVGTNNLREAVEAYRLALTEVNHECAPDLWGHIQHGLGTALCAIGERETGTSTLTEAVGALRLALGERTRESAPMAWALTQNNLGCALATLGDRENCATTVRQSVEAFRSALEERTRAHVPLDWAMTQHNLGVALSTLADRESNTECLEEALAAHQAAVLERTRERAPKAWAMSQYALGNLLKQIGNRKNCTASLVLSVQAYEAALQEYRRELDPMSWAKVQHNLGTALDSLGQRDRGTERLEDATKAYSAALSVLTEEVETYHCRVAQSNLANAQALLDARRERKG
jgi:tetratricopeptide (TPR) repeat protein